MKTQLFRFTFLLSICLTLPLTTIAQVVDIPDSNLRAAIDTALNKAPGATITAAEMKTLNRLEARNANIRNLTGLEFAINLRWLDLGVEYVEAERGYINSNAVSDILPVSGLTNLTELFLAGNAISNISPVAGLTNLKALDFQDNTISDISPLAGLTNLIWLSLVGNTISDLSPLVANTGMASEDKVDVHGNPLNYASIRTRIPALQERGVEAIFDNRMPRTIRMVSGDDQEGSPDAALASPFIVEVQDENSVAFEGVPVTFAVTAGGGTLRTTNTTTDADGRAESILMLGPGAEANTVEVSVAGIQEQQIFNAEGIRTPKKIEIISGDDQQGLPGAALEEPFVVEVRDQSDKPLPNAEVTFSVTSGGERSVRQALRLTATAGRRVPSPWAQIRE